MDPDFLFDPEFNPIDQTSFVSPVDTREFTSSHISQLYDSEQLTQDEYMILDFLGINTIEKSGSLLISFQGLKRLTELHQARVTKALNRLMVKGFLEKIDASYRLTETGLSLFTKLVAQFRDTNSQLNSGKHYTVTNGLIQGPPLSPFQIKRISDGLVGKWFGKYRFITKVDFENAFEICWISTNTSITATLKIGPGNSLILAVSAPLQTMAQQEIHLLTEHLSQILEENVDAPVVFNSYRIYEDDGKYTKEVDDGRIQFAG